ncbi:MAG: flagellar hook-basal body complex protein, partial [Bacillota bacterium]
MMRSLFAGVSGLKSHQVKMDVLGNNIANVNTTGFKASRVSFAEMFSQTLRGASAPSDERGGTSAQQIGLGAMISSIDIIHGQGNLQSTGGDTDMAIEGQGFFILRTGDQVVYSRAGAFQPDADGFLVDPTGARVQGWIAEAGELPRADETNLGDIRIPLGETIGARASTEVIYRNNLNSASENGYEWTTPVEVFDSVGDRHTIQMSFTRTGENEWSWAVTSDSEAIVDITDGTGTIRFDEDGIAEEDDVLGTATLQMSEAADIELSFDFSNVTQFYGSTTASAVGRDGHPMGTLESFTVD